MSGKQLPIEQITKLADDIRVIKDFAENHNFDASLFKAKITPTSVTSKSRDLPLITLFISITFLFGTLGILTFAGPFSQKANGFIFLIGMLFVISSVVSAHKKFKETIVTTIFAIGLIFVLLVGAGIFTPREAADRLQQLNK